MNKFHPVRFLPGLLLDFRISNITTAGSSFFKANEDDADGVFSRSHDFGNKFINTGLQTQFFFGAAVSTVPEPASVVLVTVGLFVIAGLSRRRRWVL